MRKVRFLVPGLFVLVALAVSGVLPAAAAAPAGAAPVFTPVGPVDAHVLSMPPDGSTLVGTQIFGSFAFSWTKRRGTQILGPAAGQTSISRDGAAIVADIEDHGHRTAARWRGGTSWRTLPPYPGSQ